MAEFDALFATAVREPHRVSDTLLRLALDPSAETTARNLIARESVCCSFFTFTVAGGRAELTIDVEVPPAQTEVLDGVMARAAGRCCA